MMKATFKLPNGGAVEAELSFEQFKELIGVNGHAVSPQLASAGPLKTERFERPDYDGFKKALTPKAKQFLSILRQNPNGISADHLADGLGFESGAQLGGMAGGGMGKAAPQFHVDLGNVYTREIKFENGERVVIYRPGKDIELVA